MDNLNLTTMTPLSPYLDSLPRNAPKCHHFGFVKTYPLHQAAKDGNWQMMNLLMTFGADPKQKDSAGKFLDCGDVFKAAEWCLLILCKTLL